MAKKIIIAILVLVLIIIGGASAYEYFIVKNNFLNKGWEGHWFEKKSFTVTEDYQEYKTIDIKDIVGSSFKFHILSVAGYNHGEIGTEQKYETAKITGNTARADMGDGCIALFKLDNNSLSLETSGCESYAGYGVSFDGDFQKNNN